MTEHVIVPHESFGPVRFGMTVSEVETVMGRPSDAIIFPKEHSYDGFGRVGYDDDGRCERVESYYPDVRAVVEGIPLQGTFDEATAALVDAGHEVDGAGTDEVNCRSLGVGLWREWDEDEELGSVTGWGPDYVP